MALKLFGIIWIFFGIMAFVKPKKILERIQSKGIKKVRLLLISVTLAFSAMLFSVALNHSGIIAKIAGIFGIIGIVKAFSFLNTKFAEKMMNWTTKLPDIVLRIGAIFYILFGMVLFTFSA